jgi:hypothetical protein
LNIKQLFGVDRQVKKAAIGDIHSACLNIGQLYQMFLNSHTKTERANYLIALSNLGADLAEIAKVTEVEPEREVYRQLEKG